jgi:hypothetical protein
LREGIKEEVLPVEHVVERSKDLVIMMPRKVAAGLLARAIRRGEASGVFGVWLGQD